MDIEALKNSHLGSDIYVIANGPSTQLIEPSFFSDKITIGINNAALDLGWLTYVITRYHECARSLLENIDNHQARVFVSRHQHGNTDNPIIEIAHQRVTVFDHNMNCGSHSAAIQLPQEPKLVSTFSTITSAIHLAAYLGAKSCILVGHDCGLLNQRFYRADYRHGPVSKALVEFFPIFEQQSIIVKDLLLTNFGMTTYSLSPFINPSLEGNQYFSMTSSVNIGLSQKVFLRAKYRLHGLVVNPLKVIPKPLQKLLPKVLRKRLARILIYLNRSR